jgi:arabinoxylan arabinofuranohydrolase
MAYLRMFKKVHCKVCFVLLLTVNGLWAQNPFLPPWEYIPDGEPRVFGNRVYIYGSHDKAGSDSYCDKRYVVWSASLDSLTHWRMESESFHTKADGIYEDDVPWSDNHLYAPDVVGKDGKYYLYAYIVGAPGCVAVSDVPGGPFTVVSKYKAPAGAPSDFGGWGQYIDPGVLVDDDGRVYIYWGYKRSYMAEINPANMYEILPNTYKEDIIPTAEPFKFFEGASMRKINGTYYFVYAQGANLAYATSSSPTGPFAYRGVIIGNWRDYPGGNIHGSLCNLNGQWYIFYHRHTHNTAYSRKACAERVTINADGSIDEVGMTSLGFSESLDPYKEWSPYIACVLKGGSYITEIDSFTHPVVNNKNGSIIGFKYFDFTSDTVTQFTRFTAQIRGAVASGEIELWIDSWDPSIGRKIGFVEIENDGVADATWTTVMNDIDTVTGVHALYFKFLSDNKNALICDIKSFQFEKTDQTNPNPPNNRPEVKLAIENFTVPINHPDTLGYVDLKNIFFDKEDTTSLSYQITGNTNSNLITTVIDADAKLNLLIRENTTGKSVITIKATDKKGKDVSTTFTVQIYDPASGNKALFRKVEATSYEKADFGPEMINDGNMGTRWSSEYYDNQSVTFTLDTVYLIKKIMLFWENAYGEDYNVMVSNDNISWDTVARVVGGNGGTDKVLIDKDVKGRYVKLGLLKRATQWGFSLWEVQVFEDAENKAPAKAINLPNQKIKVGDAYNYVLPKGAFSDDGDELQYTASLANGDDLPDWLTFDDMLLTLSGTPAIENKGNFDIQITATDVFGASGSSMFKLTVEGILGMKPGKSHGLKIYPNPAEGHLIFDTGGMVFNRLLITDITGNKRYEENVSNHDRQYMLAIDLPNGYYLAQLFGNEHVESIKFVVANIFKP